MFPVEVFQNTLATIAAILRQLHVRFYLTGGVTSVLYGEPRRRRISTWWLIRGMFQLFDSREALETGYLSTRADPG